MSLRFFINEQEQHLEDFAPETTLLNYLRQIGLTGTKEGCGTGDCGACTVIMRQGDTLETLNSCLCPIGALDGAQVFTVESLASSEGLHPVQQAMVDLHASQCGFCTPGFVMSAAALYWQQQSVTREDVLEALGGNLCRCTGYRPIIDATLAACNADKKAPEPTHHTRTPNEAPSATYALPLSLEQATAIKQAQPDIAVLNGATDYGLALTQTLVQPAAILDLSRVNALKQWQLDGSTLTLGAGLSFTALESIFAKHLPSAVPLLKRIGSRQIRNRGTLGGNLGSASPIGDLPPLLIALDAEIQLSAHDGSRWIQLASFFTGYRTTQLQPNELITAVRFKLLDTDETLHCHKISKRHEDDISTVLTCLKLKHQGHTIIGAKLGLGGMAATPIDAPVTAKAILELGRNQSWLPTLTERITEDCSPMSDARASSEYRIHSACGTLERTRLELIHA